MKGRVILLDILEVTYLLLYLRLSLVHGTGSGIPLFTVESEEFIVNRSGDVGPVRGLRGRS